jgi:carboxypeptidase T
MLRFALALLLLAAPLAHAQAPPAPLPVPVGSEAAGTTFYPTYPLLTAELQGMAARHPDILRLHAAGQTQRGLTLWLVEVADFENPAKVPLAQREVLWVDGGTHASEYSGVMFVLHLLKFLAEGYGSNDTATAIVEQRHTWIMPLLNPEGSMSPVGRLNGNLVNINRNYPVGWGDLPEGFPMNNPGPYPASEAETQVVTAWWAALQPDYVASIHCCGNLWLYPYGIEGRDPHPDDGPVFARICDEAYASVREFCGPIWSTIYPASGSSVDTAYEHHRSNAWGFEMSGREGNLPFTQRPIEETESESWAGILHAFGHVERYGAYPVLAALGATAGEVRVRVANDGWGNLTRGDLQVTDARGQVRTVALPFLAPGQAADLVVQGAFGQGAYPIQVQYQKRGIGGEGVLAHGLRLATGPGGLVASLDAAAPLTLHGGQANATPFPAGLALLALAGVALAARRAKA